MDFSQFFLSKKAESVENSPDTIKQLALDQKVNHLFLEALIPFSTEPYKVIHQAQAADLRKDLKLSIGIYPSAMWLLWEEKILPSGLLLDAFEALPCLIELKEYPLKEEVFYQLRLKGFAACLLDAGRLSLQELQFYIEILTELGMDHVIKVCSLKDLMLALASDGKVIGIDWTQKFCLEQAVQLEKQIKIHASKRLFVAIRHTLSFDQMKQDLKKGFLAFCFKNVQQ